MSAAKTFFCAIGCGLLTPASALALGTESIGSDPLNPRNYDSWPRLVEVVNRPDRVYQSWVNGNENCYYRSDIAALNAAIVTFSKAELKVHQVVLVPGTGRVKTFGSETVACNWRLHILGGLAAGDAKRNKPEKGEMGVLLLNPAIYIFVDKEFKLKALKIPANVKLLGDRQLVKRYLATVEAE